MDEQAKVDGRITLAAATSFIASVIFLVFVTEPIRVRSSFIPAEDTYEGEGQGRIKEGHSEVVGGLQVASKSASTINATN